MSIIRIHTFNGTIKVNGLGPLSPETAAALGTELNRWAKELAAGRSPATRLVYPGGRRVTEVTGKPAWKFL